MANRIGYGRARNVRDESQAKGKRLLLRTTDFARSNDSERSEGELVRYRHDFGSETKKNNILLTHKQIGLTSESVIFIYIALNLVMGIID